METTEAKKSREYWLNCKMRFSCSAHHFRKLMTDVDVPKVESRPEGSSHQVYIGQEWLGASDGAFEFEINNSLRDRLIEFLAKLPSHPVTVFVVPPFVSVWHVRSVNEERRFKEFLINRRPENTEAP